MAAADDAAGGGAAGSMKSCEVGRMPGQLQTEDAAAREFKTFLDLLPSSPKPAICSTDGRRPLSFAGLHTLASQVNPASFGVGRTHRLCVVLPNGPESAAAFLALSTHCVYAPLNLRLTEPELAFEFEDLPARAVVVQSFTVEGGAKKDVDSSGIVKVARRMNVPILELVPDLEECGIFALSWHAETPLRLKQEKKTSPRRGDLAIVLHTSGTTKKPKIVPLTHENITVGSQCIASTLQLQADKDFGINIMPLFHIHGLSINVLASMLSGTPILATPGFDVDKFFVWLEDRKPTWYSAVPTMHQQILERASERNKAAGAVVPNSLELVRNCSAALLPHVAEGLEGAFSCVVMPTYAMTESMPIASNPRTANRGTRKLRAEQRGDGGGTVGSVGLSGGPRIRLCNDDGGPVEPYNEGEICVSGECVTAGYEFREHMDADPNVSAFHCSESGCKWLRTGDKGWVDGDGFLALTGRFKEIINRGGEKISPLEVEEVLRTHKGVRDMIAFAAPHEELGETVGAAVVEAAGGRFPDDPEEAIASLRSHGAAAGLNQKWLPDCLVFLEAVPKGPTGKPARINLASRLHLPSLSGAARTVWDVEGPPPLVDKAPFAVDSVRKRRPPRPPRPGMALQGARVFFNFLVFFNHVGFTNHRGLQQMRNNAGYTMTGFFFILGFTMTSSIPEGGIALSELRDFWVSRMGPAHAVFVLQVFLSNVYFNMRCQQSFFKQCRDPGYMLQQFLLAAFTTKGQLHEMTAGYTWFVTKMYAFILLFPLLNLITRTVILRKACVLRFSVVLATIGATVVSPVTTYFYQIPSPYSVAVWMCAFCAGMLSWHVFQRAGRRSIERRRLWGIITDLATIPMLGVFVAAYFDTCVHKPYRYHPFNYSCEEGYYEVWRWHNNHLAGFMNWAGRNMTILSILRLISPVTFVWLYGLSVGEGYVAWLLSRPPLAKFLAPLAYNVFIMQLPAFWTWWYLTRGLKHQQLFTKILPFPVQAPVPMGEGLCLVVLTYSWSWFYDRYMSPYLVPPTVRIMNLLAGLVFFPFTATGLIPSNKLEDGGSTLDEILQIIRRLTGRLFAADDRIEDLNLDSFGTMALIGMLKATKPHLSDLRASTLHELGTVGALSAWVEAQDPRTAKQKTA